MPPTKRRLPIFPLNGGDPIMAEATIEEEPDRTTITLVVENNTSGARYIAELMTADTLIGLSFSGV